MKRMAKEIYISRPSMTVMTKKERMNKPSRKLGGRIHLTFERGKRDRKEEERV